MLFRSVSQSRYRHITQHYQLDDINNDDHTLKQKRIITAECTIIEVDNDHHAFGERSVRHLQFNGALLDQPNQLLLITFQRTAHILLRRNVDEHRHVVQTADDLHPTKGERNLDLTTALTVHPDLDHRHAALNIEQFVNALTKAFFGPQRQLQAIAALDLVAMPTTELLEGRVHLDEANVIERAHHHRDRYRLENNDKTIAHLTHLAHNMLLS